MPEARINELAGTAEAQHATLTVRLEASSPARLGDQLALTLDGAALHLFSAEDGRNLEAGSQAGSGAGATASGARRSASSAAASMIMSSWPPTMRRRPSSISTSRGSTPNFAAARSACSRNEL